MVSCATTRQTPFEPSKYPGAGSIRICTAIRFLFTQDSLQEQPFVLLNTHLDDQSDAQRQLGASMLLMRAQYEAVKFGPVLLTGDFNRCSSDL
jgi:endonuclease/exonuclease/phosphatase family metal-dependent hydrolase